MKRPAILIFVFASSLAAQVQLGKNVQIGAGAGAGNCSGTSPQVAFFGLTGNTCQGDPLFLDHGASLVAGGLEYLGNGATFSAIGGGNYVFTTSNSGSSGGAGLIDFSTSQLNGRNISGNIGFSTSTNGGGSGDIVLSSSSSSGSTSGLISISTLGTGASSNNIDIAASGGNDGNSGKVSLGGTGNVSIFAGQTKQLLLGNPVTVSNGAGTGFAVLNSNPLQQFDNFTYNFPRATGTLALTGTISSATAPLCANGTGGVLTDAGCTGGGGSGVSSINTVPGAFTFSFSAGAGSCSGTTCTFTGSGTGGGSVISFAAPSGSWPTWLVPAVTNSTTTPSLAVAASAIPNSALANSSMTINSTTCTLGSSCTVSTSGSGSVGTTGQLQKVGSTAGSFAASAATDNGATFAISLPTTINDGTGKAGAIQLLAGTAPSAAPASTIQINAPTAVTAYSVNLPGAQGTGALTNDGAGNLSWTPSGAGSVTAVTGTSPIASSGGTAPAISCPTCGVTGSPLSQFAATTSAQLAGVLSNETGTGLVVFGTSPTLVTPVLGTPASATLTNATGLPLTTGVTGLLPNANLANPSTTVNGTTCTLGSTCTVGIALATTTVGTTAIAANTCTTATTVTMTGVATTSTFAMTPNADVSGIVGWGSVGGLAIVAWPTANTLNYRVCNQTAASITPGASVTFNVSAR